MRNHLLGSGVRVVGGRSPALYVCVGCDECDECGEPMNPTSVMPEFHYRLPMRAGGSRPGSHPGSSFGAGQEFAMHARLFDHPDPRRIDLRASMRAIPAEWLVRVTLLLWCVVFCGYYACYHLRGVVGCFIPGVPWV